MNSIWHPIIYATVNSFKLDIYELVRWRKTLSIIKIRVIKSYWLIMNRELLSLKKPIACMEFIVIILHWQCIFLKLFCWTCHHWMLCHRFHIRTGTRISFFPSELLSLCFWNRTLKHPMDIWSSEKAADMCWWWVDWYTSKYQLEVDI